MSLTYYRTLGRSGLVVSPMALGAMTFGQEGWGVDEAGAGAICDAYLDAGGNFIDTADVYAAGASEEMLGRFLRDRSLRDQVVLSTKFGFNGAASPLSGRPGGRGNPNAGGAGAKNIHRALEGSLRRLGTDHVDLYWMHVWDGVTPVDEIVGTLADLVHAGKVRYYAFSDMPAWLAAKAGAVAAGRGMPGPIAMQVEYSLVARDVEAEHVPAARDGGMGVVPWSPLAGGFLSGKYRRGDTGGTGRLSGANPFGDSKFSPRNWDVLDILKGVAAEIGCDPAQAALAWLLGRDGVSSVVVGARSVGQLRGNLAATDIVMNDDQRRRLDAASAVTPSFSAGLALPAIRRMVFGGNTVTAW